MVTRNFYVGASIISKYYKSCTKSGPSNMLSIKLTWILAICSQKEAHASSNRKLISRKNTYLNALPTTSKNIAMNKIDKRSLHIINQLRDICTQMVKAAIHNQVKVEWGFSNTFARWDRVQMWLSLLFASISHTCCAAANAWPGSLHQRYTPQLKTSKPSKHKGHLKQYLVNQRVLTKKKDEREIS